MPIVRGGFGYGAFSAGDYGTEGVIHTGAASTSVTSASTVTAQKSLVGDASTSCSSTFTAAAYATLSGGALSAGSTVTASIAEQFILEQPTKFSYGTSAYGSYVYDQSDFQTVSNGVSTATADIERVREVSASVSASASNQCQARRVPEGSALVYGTSSTGSSSIGTGARIRTGYANPAGDATGSSISATRVRESDASETGTVTTASYAVTVLAASGSTSASGSVAANGQGTFASPSLVSADSSTTAVADLILDSGETGGFARVSATATAFGTFKGASAISSTASNTAFAGYVQRSGAGVSSTASIIVLGREKWEPIPYNSSFWTNVA